MVVVWHEERDALLLLNDRNSEPSELLAEVVVRSLCLADASESARVSIG